MCHNLLKTLIFKSLINAIHYFSFDKTLQYSLQVKFDIFISGQFTK